MDPQFVLIPVMAVAGFVQAVSGFGSALVAMPILAQLFGTRTATPLFALTAIAGEAIIIFKYWDSMSFGNVWRLILATVIAIPIGIYGAPFVDEGTMLFLLGLLVFFYAVYALLTPIMPRLFDTRWGYIFGFISGLFSGAFNTGGPPYVIFASTQRWTPQEFKANIQGAFLVGSVAQIVAHGLKGNFTSDVVHLQLLAIPAFIIGTFIGGPVDRFINPVRFRRGILILLLILGLTLIF